MKLLNIIKGFNDSIQMKMVDLVEHSEKSKSVWGKRLCILWNLVEFEEDIYPFKRRYFGQKFIVGPQVM